MALTPRSLGEKGRAPCSVGRVEWRFVGHGFVLFLLNVCLSECLPGGKPAAREPPTDLGSEARRAAAKFLKDVSG